MSTQSQAVRTIRRVLDAIVSRNWDDLADAYAEHFRFEDRRAGLKDSQDKAGILERARITADLGFDRADLDLIERRGERTALVNVTTTVSATGFVAAQLLVLRVDGDGRMLVVVWFDEDAFDDARAELDALAAREQA